jgi:hypothetical protein
MIDLYHFTCQHMADEIEEKGILVPAAQTFVNVSLVWLTDMDKFDRDALGLTGHLLDCDRGDVMYRVTDYIKKPVPWIGSIWHSQADPFVQAHLHRGRDPRRWWVTDKVIRVERVEQ